MRSRLALKEHGRSGQELLDLTVSNPTCVGLSIPRGRSHAAWPTSAPCPMSLPQKACSRRASPWRTTTPSRESAIDPERLILTVSTSEAYSYCFRLLCDPGDEVLVPSPSYPLFEFLADIQDIRLVPFELVYDEGWQIEFESLTPRHQRAFPGGARGAAQQSNGLLRQAMGTRTAQRSSVASINWR